MPKQKNEAVIDSESIQNMEEYNRKMNLISKAETVQIKKATVQADFCSYSYELKDGIGAGDEINRKGSSLVHTDMLKALGMLDVHLAVIDDGFHHKGIHIDDIDNHHGDEITVLYRVNGFQISGTGENEAVVLFGSKSISVGGHIDIKTPKIEFSGNYQWVNELRVAIDAMIDEVKAYMSGYIAPKPVQTEMEFPEEGEFNND